ncbi:MAG: hypothetical protein FJ109_21685 [Deltaproteobacteria bacterium]|nr:hypothetical protein [Deltaproteobacteria bacterium]
MVGGWQRIREQIGGVTLTLLALALLTVTVHVVVFQGERREAVVLAERLNRVRQDIGRVSRENERLRHLIVNIRQTDDQVEKIGREDFGYVRSGEILYYFEPPKPPSVEKPGPAPEGKKGGSGEAKAAPSDPKAAPSDPKAAPSDPKAAPRPAGIIPPELSDQLRP